MQLWAKKSSGENVVIMMDDCAIGHQINFVSGWWDGGYDDKHPEYVGVGWHLQFRESMPVSETDLWLPLMCGGAKHEEIVLWKVKLLLSLVWWKAYCIACLLSHWDLQEFDSTKRQRLEE